MERELTYTKEYLQFVENANKRTKDKLNYAIEILKNADVISTKFVKHLINADFYELRISVDNEIRVILFAVDHDNINLSRHIVLLNGFIKKSTKDYEREIKNAIKIMQNNIPL